MSIKGTVIGKIVKSAKMKWDNLDAREAEEFIEGVTSAEQASSEVTYGSEIKAINAIAQIAHLSQEETNDLINEVYTNKNISKELSEKINNSINGENKYKNILKIVSYIHDEWVKNNSNNFLSRPKDYQFVDYRLLPYKEILSDFLFLQPILEASGISIEDDKLREEFLNIQNGYLIDEKILSHKVLVERLMLASQFYPSLQGLTTKVNDKDVLIDDLLKNEDIAEKMAKQIEEQIGKQFDEQNEEQIRHQRTDMHTHLNGVLPGKVMSDLALNLLEMEIDPKSLEIDNSVDVFNKMQEAYKNRKKIVDELIKNGHGNDLLRAIAKEYKKHGIDYVEMTTDFEILKRIKEKKIDILAIEKETGVSLRFLLGLNRNNLPLEVFNNKEIQNLFVDNPYLVGIDIMRI